MCRYRILTEKRKASLRSLRKDVMVLMLRKFQSEYHARRWVDYENVLVVRTMMFTAGRLLMIAFAILNGKEQWHLTEDFIEKGGPPNLELALKLLPYFKIVCMMQRAATVLCFIVCLKWPRLVKWLIYFEMLDEVINVGLPIEIESSTDVTFRMLVTTLRFIICYFNGFAGIFWANVSMSTVFFRRALLFDEEVGGLVIGYVLTVVSLTANLIFAHLILTKIGMIYIDAEVLREGNDSTLNNLEEGVVILKEEDLQVQFQN